MNLTQGNWQVPVAEKDHQRQPLIHHYEFRMISFGLQGAPATSQQMMGHLIQGARDFAIAYLDDLMIYVQQYMENHLYHFFCTDKIR